LVQNQTFQKAGMMTLTINDTGSDTRLVISNGSKTLLKKKGKSIKSLLKYVYEGTNREYLKKSIVELQHTYMFMVGSKTTITIKER